MKKKGFRLTKKKGILLILILFASFVTFIGYKMLSKDNKTEETVIPANDRIAMYAYNECGGTTGYSMTNFTTIAEAVNAGYVYNSELSTCTNGATISYDSTNNTVSVNTTSATSCNIYFDYYGIKPSNSSGTIGYNEMNYQSGMPAMMSNNYQTMDNTGSNDYRIQLLSNSDITAFEDGGDAPVGVYKSITCASIAAGENGRIVLGSGTYEFDKSQMLVYPGQTLEGAEMTSTTITTSANFGNASTEDRYSLITTTGSNITIKDLTINGGSYGAYLVPTSSAETKFSVIRAVSGSLNLDSIRISNSKRNLLVIGDELNTNGNSLASVTTNNVVFEGSDKPVDLVNTYYDVKISYGSLTLDANSVIDCVIGLDPNSSSSIKQLNIGNRDDLYTFGVPSTFWTYPFYTSATSTSKYFLYLYSACTTDPFKSTFVKLYDYSQNQDAIDDMVWSTIDSLEDGATSDELMTANQLLNLIAYLHFVAYPDNTTIEDMYDELNNAIASAEY